MVHLNFAAGWNDENEKECLQILGGPSSSHFSTVDRLKCLMRSEVQGQCQELRPRHLLEGCSLPLMPSPNAVVARARSTRRRHSVIIFNWYTRNYAALNVVVVWVLAFLLHISTLGGSFVWDDRAAVMNNHNVNHQRELLSSSPTWSWLWAWGGGPAIELVPGTIWKDDFWGAPLDMPNSHKSYRPLTTLTYRLNFLLHDFYPRGYHLVNLCLHASVCALVLLTARVMLGGISTHSRRSYRGGQQEISAMLAALLFLVHPIHVESVCPIVGRADCLCGFFYLSAFLVYCHSTTSSSSKTTPSAVMGILLAYLLGLAAFLSKEVGLTVFGLMVVHDLFPPPSSLGGSFSGPIPIVVSFVRDSLARLRQIAVAARVLGCFMSLAAVLYIRLRLHGEKVLMRWSILENEISYLEPLSARVLAIAHVHFIYLWKLFFPFRQSYDYGFSCLHHVTSFLDLRNCLAVGTYASVASLIYYGLRTRSPKVLMPLALLLVSLLPASHAFFFVGAVVAERLLYLPSVGFCILVGECLGSCAFKADAGEAVAASPPGPIDSAAASPLHCHRSSRHLATTITTGLVFSTWVFAFGFRSVYYAGQWTDGEEAVFANARRVCPTSAKVLNNYALAFLNTTHAAQGQKDLATALEVFPQYANAHYNKGLSHFLLGDYEPARMHFAASLETDTYNLQAYSYLGQVELFLYEQQRQVEGAAVNASLWAQLAEHHMDIALDNGLQSATTNHFRGALALALEKPHLAVDYFEKALQINQRSLEERQSPRWKVVRQNSEYLNVPLTYNLLGLAYKTLGRLEEAQRSFLLGVEQGQEPRPVELLGNLALLLLETNQLELAHGWFTQALAIQPGSYDLLNNMGVVEERRGAFSHARHYFQQAWDLFTNEKKTKDNLSVSASNRTHVFTTAPAENRTRHLLLNNIKRVEHQLMGLTV